MIKKEEEVLKIIDKYNSVMFRDVQWTYVKAYSMWLIKFTIKESLYLMDYMAFGDIKKNIYDCIGNVEVQWNIDYM